mmetsp:Transcript_24189/g.62334  ORF Transcript_24189/g.62334 Transcript_24189/m.62334 type:complete len:284 (-) Transcript_24189:235-1086(-)
MVHQLAEHRAHERGQRRPRLHPRRIKVRVGETHHNWLHRHARRKGAQLEVYHRRAVRGRPLREQAYRRAVRPRRVRCTRVDHGGHVLAARRRRAVDGDGHERARHRAHHRHAHPLRRSDEASVHEPGERERLDKGHVIAHENGGARAPRWPAAHADVVEAQREEHGTQHPTDRPRENTPHARERPRQRRARRLAQAEECNAREEPRRGAQQRERDQTHGQKRERAERELGALVPRRWLAKRARHKRVVRRMLERKRETAWPALCAQLLAPVRVPLLVVRQRRT